MEVSLEQAPPAPGARPGQAGIVFGFDDGGALEASAALPGDGELLLAEVDSLGQDPLFEEVLAKAGSQP